ncbi:putative bifunctional diguanylate cyclase/phosphodiesterase [Luteimonas terrae]|uniref:EAL domain-containing protein (Putative c-di-GMP-specific phosphodiesterase class I)/GGDEF domain-containing protein n=1 Tax=Luteimonas terrae TaxID=1530191 RepID=A0ABU1Y0T1_9GAMM|nr:GGDEF and EAL domain-containing protein [Luteimonas terrae]MDR7194629.1 EAL domain-containing protein (putative c-di-GMP-specific phosphodiesterase class I)/GGDEF domain-containing protein [Luteimonas terrae]
MDTCLVLQPFAAGLVPAADAPPCLRDAVGEAAEVTRLAALRDLALLDTPESDSFDRITRMASRLFDTPIAAVSLTDAHRQWFKSHVGTAGREIPRDKAPCAEVTASAQVLVVPDLQLDPRFRDGVLARSGVRFYAGAPLITRDGHALGAMCVLDRTPREASADDLASLRDFAAMVMAQVELERDYGRRDPLSGLPNRNQFADDLADLARVRPGVPRVLLLVSLLDPARLQELVSVMGMHCIDDLVQASSRILKDRRGAGCIAYHVGVVSYAVLVDEADAGPWANVMAALSAALAVPVASHGIPVQMLPVFGVSPFTAGAAAADDALRTGISAANDARTMGLDSAVYSPASDAANRRRLTLLADFANALAQPGALSLVYQPRIDLRAGRCTGAEALLRWRHPALGDVSPAEFVPLVEQTALARPMTEWVLGAALDQQVAWRAQGASIAVSINVSARNLEETDFLPRLAAHLARRGLPADGLELELTETALMRNVEHVLAQLEGLRDMGVTVAIDDFGTGYSNFDYLRKLPARAVKLDRSFIGDLGSDSDVDARPLARAMIGIAHDLGLRVVAEGVETQATLDLLRAWECDEVQGYFTGRPMSAAALLQTVSA